MKTLLRSYSSLLRSYYVLQVLTVSIQFSKDVVRTWLSVKGFKVLIFKCTLYISREKISSCANEDRSTVQYVSFKEYGAHFNQLRLFFDIMEIACMKVVLCWACGSGDVISSSGHFVLLGLDNFSRGHYV